LLAKRQRTLLIKAGNMFRGVITLFVVILLAGCGEDARFYKKQTCTSDTSGATICNETP
jgi:hypothetical protein